jgi:exodeoxyribonuclease VII small subunit
LAKEKLKFEQAMARLEKIIEGIEQGQIGLEESIERFAEGMELIRTCRTVLAHAEMKIQKLQADAAGDLKAEPMSEPSGDNEAQAG